MKNGLKRVLAGIMSLTLVIGGALSTTVTTSAYNISNKIIHGIYYNSTTSGEPTILGNRLFNEACSDDNLIEELQNTEFKCGLGIAVYALNEILVENITDYDGNVRIVDPSANKVLHANDLYCIDSSFAGFYDIADKALEYSSMNDEDKEVARDKINAAILTCSDLTYGYSSVNYYLLMCSIMDVTDITEENYASVRKHIDNLTPVLYHDHGMNYTGYYDVDFDNKTIGEIDVPCYSIDRSFYNQLTFEDYELTAFSGLRCTTQDIYDKLNTTVDERIANSYTLGTNLVYSTTYGGFATNDPLNTLRYPYVSIDTATYDILDSFTGIRKYSGSNFLIWLETKPIDEFEGRLVPCVFNCDIAGYETNSDLLGNNSYYINPITVDFSNLISEPSEEEDHKFYRVYYTKKDNPYSYDYVAITGMFTLGESFSADLSNCDHISSLVSWDANVTIPQISKEDLDIIIPSNCFSNNYTLNLVEYTTKDGMYSYRDIEVKADCVFSEDDNAVVNLVDNAGNVVSSAGNGEAIAYTDELLSTNGMEFVKPDNYVEIDTKYNFKVSVSPYIESTFEDYSSNYVSLDFYIYDFIDEFMSSSYYNNLTQAITDTTIEKTCQPYYETIGSNYISKDEYSYARIGSVDITAYVNFYTNLVYGSDSFDKFIDPEFIDVKYSARNLVKLKTSLLNSEEIPYYEFLAYDLKSDNTINVLDLVSLKKKLLE